MQTFPTSIYCLLHDRQFIIQRNQLKAIRFLEEQGALKTLPEALQQAAARRLEYPDLSLAALCGCFDPPMSKSGLSHRMKKLEALADALRQRLEEHTETKEAGA